MKGFGFNNSLLKSGKNPKRKSKKGTNPGLSGATFHPSRKLLRNMFRAKFGNKGMRQAWMNMQINNLGSIGAYVARCKATDPARRHNKIYNIAETEKKEPATPKNRTGVRRLFGKRATA